MMSDFNLIRKNGLVPLLISESGHSIPIVLAVLLCTVGGIIA